MMGVIGSATAILGPVIERKGPQWAVFSGTTLFLIGHIVTALGIRYKSIVGVYIGYGVIIAIGLDYRGTAAGFAVAGSGAGAVVWSKVYLPTIAAVGLSWMFVLLGEVMSTAMFLCVLVLRVPPSDFTVHGVDIHGQSVNRNNDIEDNPSTTYKICTTPTTAIHAATSSSSTPPMYPFTLKQALWTPDFLFMYLMFFANQLFGVIVLSRLYSMCTD
ncbi:hypothetical protein CCR75_005936 [Bremia lactucae]|uniref:Uncharacterized protein n=1 Tax=Bremia lactucae TaxID=4779 RepID=A0A976IL47_BRELC|nr:hypothetical protein CCR75_005936 [Bremia lactucae]